MREPNLNIDEFIYCPENDETLLAPRGTEADMDFLRSVGIDAWDAFGLITFMNGEFDGYQEGSHDRWEDK